MIEKQRLRHGLQKIDKVIVPADVCEFMRQHGFQLLHAEAQERRGWKQNYRPQPTHNAGSISEPGDHHAHGAADSHPVCQARDRVDNWSFSSLARALESAYMPGNPNEPDSKGE